jgi:hypothetical protein
MIRHPRQRKGKSEMAATINQMKRRVNSFSRLTLDDIRKQVQKTTVDTNVATAQAAEIERHFLVGCNRDVRIAVFLAGLMANLIDD